jgi:hypothetical protein
MGMGMKKLSNWLDLYDEQVACRSTQGAFGLDITRVRRGEKKYSSTVLAYFMFVYF